MDLKNIGYPRVGTYFGFDENKTCEEIERNGHETGAAFRSKSQRSTVDTGKSRSARILCDGKSKRNYNSDAFAGLYFKTQPNQI